MSALEMRSAMRLPDGPNAGRVRLFAEAQKRALEQKVYEMHLNFAEFGYSWNDVQWIQDLGFTLNRNGACLWWEVTWNE
jgi:hypothetical protein